MGVIASFNWATSLQKWKEIEQDEGSLGESLFQLGHFFAEMERETCLRALFPDAMFQLGHFFAEMESDINNFELTYWQRVSIGPLLCRNGKGFSPKRLRSTLRFNWATSLQKWKGQTSLSPIV